MKLKTIVSPEMGENCYIVIDESTNKAVIIDPGEAGYAYKVCNTVEKEGLDIAAICLTHCHFDHAGGAEEVKAKTNAPIFICENEEIVAQSENYNLSAAFGKPFKVPYDRVLKDGEKFKFGDLEFKTILTPGHTPGGCCYYFENEGVLFSGDTLFCMSVGRTDFPGGNSSELIKSIKDKLFVLPDDTAVFTGHGQQTSIGFEKDNNGFIY